MHFRERAQVVQLIRTVYDPNTKKGKNQLVGRLAKANPQLTDELKATLTSQERQEVQTWIAGHSTLQRLRREIAVRTLPESLALAEEWFSDKKGDDARFLAATLMPAWIQLRTVFKRNGLID